MSNRLRNFQKEVPANLILNSSDDSGGNQWMQAALIAFAAGLADELSPLKERIAGILKLDDFDDAISAIRDLQSDLPEILAQSFEKDSASEILSKTSSTSFFNGAAQVNETDELDSPKPFSEISKKLSEMAALESLTPKEVSDIGSDIKARSDWATASTKANIIQEISDRLGDLVEQAIDVDSIRSELGEVSDSFLSLGEGDDADGLESRSSVLGTMFVIPALAGGFGWLLAAGESTEDFPCQELYRAEERIEPRNWPERWSEAGGQFYEGESDYPEGRMIAPIGDDIFAAISRWGVPVCPLDYNSGMRFRLVSYDESVQIGAIDAGEQVEPTNSRLNDKVVFNGDLTDDLRRVLLDFLGSDFSFNPESLSIVNSPEPIRNHRYQRALDTILNQNKALAFINGLTDDNPLQREPIHKLMMPKKKKILNEGDGGGEAGGGAAVSVGGAPYNGGSARLASISSKPHIKKFSTRK